MIETAAHFGGSTLSMVVILAGFDGKKPITTTMLRMTVSDLVYGGTCNTCDDERSR
jgi:hypothetical protein